MQQVITQLRRGLGKACCVRMGYDGGSLNFISRDKLSIPLINSFEKRLGSNQSWNMNIMSRDNPINSLEIVCFLSPLPPLYAAETADECGDYYRE